MERKKLGKLSFGTMELRFKPVNNELLSKITGGGCVSTYEMEGGTITNWKVGKDTYAV